MTYEEIVSVLGYAGGHEQAVTDHDDRSHRGRRHTDECGYPRDRT